MHQNNKWLPEHLLKIKDTIPDYQSGQKQLKLFNKQVGDKGTRLFADNVLFVVFTSALLLSVGSRTFVLRFVSPVLRLILHHQALSLFLKRAPAWCRA